MAKKKKSQPLTAHEWYLYRCLGDLVLGEQEKKMTVAEWKYKKIQEFKNRSGGW
jgi:gentisate 1,2-dioxygenase